MPQERDNRMTEPEALLQLQEIDLDLMRLRTQLESLPQKARIDTIKTASKKVSSEITKIVGQRKDVEMDISDHDADRKKIEGLVGEVQEKAGDGGTDYRAIRDLEGQLSALAKRLEKIEFETTGLMETLERLEKAERNARGISAKLADELSRQTTSYQESILDIRKEVERLGKERELTLKELSPALVARYDVARKRFNGLAVETLNGNKPSACRVSLQPSQYSDLKHAGPISECPYCHRLLIVGRED